MPTSCCGTRPPCSGAGPGGLELLASRTGRTRRDITSGEIHTYLKDKVCGEVSAKGFRTWHGTVIAAVALAQLNSTPRTGSAREPTVSQAMKQVASYLGNTPAEARKSNVDPRLVDLFDNGITISPELAGLDTDLSDGTTHGKMEEAVLDLLQVR